MGTLIILAIYTVVVLVFVPLDKIGKAQRAVKNWIKKATDKIEDKEDSK